MERCSIAVSTFAAIAALLLTIALFYGASYGTVLAVSVLAVPACWPSPTADPAPREVRSRQR